MAFFQSTYDDDNKPVPFMFSSRTVYFSAFPQDGPDDNTLMLAATKVEEQAWRCTVVDSAKVGVLPVQVEFILHKEETIYYPQKTGQSDPPEHPKWKQAGYRDLRI